MIFSKPISEIVKARFSCRSYTDTPISIEEQHKLSEFMTTMCTGPLGTATRFELIAGTQDDVSALKGLGTYGFIKNPTGFLSGAVATGTRNLEDYAYLLEHIVLVATDIGLGTCWLGGSFTKSRFAKKLALRKTEVTPAVIATGHCVGDPEKDRLRKAVKGNQRVAWDTLFFENDFETPLTEEKADVYAQALEMVRLGPSASNKQPWRIIKQGANWHFYLQRTPGYNNKLGRKLLGISDVQRLDMGIAMCHFELTAKEQGRQGHWEINEPDIQKPDTLMEYSVTWRG